MYIPLPHALSSQSEDLVYSFLFLSNSKKIPGYYLFPHILYTSLFIEIHYTFQDFRSSIYIENILIRS